ncbi:MAG: hypothetical protein NTW03_13715 [Verrucomicrobia bacterium]|nr:hypothetical protein [Verrucomicrobiota bacterium]
MAKPRSIDVVVVLTFLAVIFSVSTVQVVLEARRGEWPQAWDVFRHKPSADLFRVYEQNLEEASLAVKLLRPWMQYAQVALLHDMGAKTIAGTDGWLFYRPGVQYLTERPRPRQATATPAQAVAAIVDFRNQLAARGLRLLVVPTPNKESVYPERLTRRAAHLHGLLGTETRAVLDGLKAADVEVVDLFSAFANAKATAAPSTPPLYLAQDSHWSPGGVQLAARAVAGRIRTRNWAAPGSAAYQVKPCPIARVGDLVRMLQAPQVERHVVPESISCAQIASRETGQLYQDKTNAEILVLGDSFLRIYEQDEPGAAGFIAHLARELNQPVASIVSDGGASTLVRQELYRHPAFLVNKKLVIWEFVERDIRLGTERWQHVPLPPEPRAGIGNHRGESAGLAGAASGSGPL